MIPEMRGRGCAHSPRVWSAIREGAARQEGRPLSQARRARRSASVGSLVTTRANGRSQNWCATARPAAQPEASRVGVGRRHVKRSAVVEVSVLVERRAALAAGWEDCRKEEGRSEVVCDMKLHRSAGDDAADQGLPPPRPWRRHPMRRCRPKLYLVREGGIWTPTAPSAPTRPPSGRRISRAAWPPRPALRGACPAPDARVHAVAGAPDRDQRQRESHTTTARPGVASDNRLSHLLVSQHNSTLVKHPPVRIRWCDPICGDPRARSLKDDSPRLVPASTAHPAQRGHEKLPPLTLAMGPCRQ